MKNQILILLMLLPFFEGYGKDVSSNRSSLPDQSETAYSMTSFNSIQRLRMNLYAVNDNSEKWLIDGTLNEFAPNYSNDLDGMDARKLSNSGVNISIRRGNTNIIIERRQTIAIADTISFKIWGAQKRTYQFEFIANTFDPSLSCLLEDNYLHTSTGIRFNDTTKINFTINNDPASANEFRFRVIFIQRSFGILPLNFISFNGQKSDNNVWLNWKTENESNVVQYFVERSGDGRSFTNIATIPARNQSSNSYGFADKFPLAKNNYYRIRSIEKDGISMFSPIVKINRENYLSDITIFPNPAKSNNLNLRIVNQQPGIYYIRLFNYSGQIFTVKEIKYTGSTRIVDISPAVPLQKGMYQLEVKAPDGTVKLIPLLF
jgi:hypothetical protein